MKNLRWSSKNNAENLVLIIVWNGHDLRTSFFMLEKNSFWFTLSNELFRNFLESKFLRNFIFNSSNI